MTVTAPLSGDKKIASEGVFDGMMLKNDEERVRNKKVPHQILPRLFTLQTYLFIVHS